ncbi:tRNA (adenine(58)-N(1))-methyltransferase non-catalytic subunit TRM6 [Halyomorpha halys]|uniref:tRNA (adenine(58)-N(1))-methyltransferase non-catalytic subunit TRM6 n=1 Tax=Halyomorpha halys TaxID=286706 RepID=UPI0006D4F256|nr:tRNA (adenine(58)-N(1))-methyltransferase non-catalytic subunit TRM6 [Halyomorpha halys]
MNDLKQNSNLIKVNSYIVIQRQGYFKLHQLSSKAEIMLGKDKIDLSCVIDKPFWTVFKMIPYKGSKREFTLEVCSQTEDFAKDFTCGADNRNITDDGSSQSLTSNDINEMRESGLSAQVILEKIIENSKTFKEKTEYSQEKYLKKKEKKYFEYIIIREPSIRLLSEIFYFRDPSKMLGLRHDALSQIYTLANIQHDGIYALFENGTQGLVGAGILNYLSGNGLLINLTINNQPQKQAILAMNFGAEKLLQFVSVKLKELINSTQNKSIEVVDGSNDTFDCNEINSLPQINLEPSSIKRKHSVDETDCVKKPRWTEDLEKAVATLKEKKLNGIIIVAREYPLNILTILLPYLKPSSQLVVYCQYREPLVQLYVELKKRKDIIGLHLLENWLRLYQVLPDRTHPDVTMNCTGHILTGIKILNS